MFQIQPKGRILLIKNNYDINEHTIALIPAKQIEYETLVMEADAIYKVKLDPLTLIKNACDADYCTYDGKRHAVTKNTGYSRKVPIPISIINEIFAFPTHSPTDYECHWFFFNHINHIQKDPSTKHTRVTLKNKQELTLPISFNIFKKQYERTLSCKVSTQGIYLK